MTPWGRQLEAPCLELPGMRIYVVQPLDNFNSLPVINQYLSNFAVGIQSKGGLGYTVCLQMSQIYIVLFINKIILFLRYMVRGIEEIYLCMD